MAENQEDDIKKVAEEKPAVSKFSKFRNMLNYQWVVKNMYFFIFLAILAVVYIYNGHYAENTVKDINKAARELKELQYEYKTVKGELMMRGKQSELAKAVEPLGLKPLKEPPLKLKEQR